MNRRQALEVLRAGPALVTGFPGDAVDIDGLLAHLIGRGFEGGIYLADLEMESLVWVHEGEAQDAWFFDVDGGEAVLAGAGGHDLFREMAASGSMLSVYVGAPPDVAFGQAAGPPSDAPATVFKVPGQVIVTAPLAPPPQPQVEVAPVEVAPVEVAPVEIAPVEIAPVEVATEPEPEPAVPFVTGPPIQPVAVAAAPVAAPPSVDPIAVATPAPVVESPPAEPPSIAASSAPAVERIAPPAPEPLAKKKRPAPETVVAAPQPPLPAIEPPAPVEPSTRPWPRTLEGVVERVARHRGQRLAQRFTATLAAAIAPHGGRLDGTRVVTPPMSEATWRVIVEAACEPIIAVAGRAFVDKTIAAAEREAMTGEAGSDR